MKKDYRQVIMAWLAAALVATAIMIQTWFDNQEMVRSSRTRTVRIRLRDEEEEEDTLLLTHFQIH